MNREELQLKFTTLDKRHRGHEEFKYYVTIDIKRSFFNRRFSYDGYLQLRELCTSVWGHSCERELYFKIKREQSSMEVNNHWVWHTDINNGQYRVYLKGDEEKAWLLLQW